MAEKSTSLILDALSRAVGAPAGLPLHGKGAAGLFAVSPAAKDAARRCKEDGFVRMLRTETKGKSTHEICAITEKGLAYLLSQASPKKVLEDLVHALAARQSESGELILLARKMQADFDALKAAAEKALQKVHKPAGSTGGDFGSTNGNETWLVAVVSCLAHRQESGATGDCPLPELFHQAQQTSPGLTIGHFHDGLRKLHAQGKLYLHPWTGPLYELPEPQLALLVGHEIAYYASLR